MNNNHFTGVHPIAYNKQPKERTFPSMLTQDFLKLARERGYYVEVGDDYIQVGDAEELVKRFISIHRRTQGFIIIELSNTDRKPGRKVIEAALHLAMTPPEERIPDPAHYYMMPGVREDLSYANVKETNPGKYDIIFGMRDGKRHGRGWTTRIKASVVKQLDPDQRELLRRCRTEAVDDDGRV